MIEQKSGQIINITTVGAEKAELGMAAYGCSKAALKMLTRCMAREWAAYGIRVNAVGPTLTRTEFSRPIWSNPDVAKHMASAIPMGRLAEPEEIVGSVLFLASGAANFITGQSLYVDGGSLTT
jgi:NAD(P)-dependent dehydrogenase (short-subunit alcohol dehydrogenase family)